MALSQRDQQWLEDIMLKLDKEDEEAEVRRLMEARLLKLRRQQG